jgi:class 3 adenylate cyclase/pimeloyl-ACP methyl ester carboxylesterase
LPFGEEVGGAYAGSSRQRRRGGRELPARLSESIARRPATVSGIRSALVLPRTQVVESAGHCIAYQVIGDGPDLLFVPGLVSHLDLQWSDPSFASALRRLASFSRLIIFDHRGVGLSDPVPGVPRLEERVDDMTAVMDAVGSESAALLGHCNGGPASVLFAATHPMRVSSMVLCASFAKGRPDAEHPGALPSGAIERAKEVIDHWGEGRTQLLHTSSVASGPWHKRMYASFERAAVSPGMARAGLLSTLEIDVTDLLPLVQAPTLVMHSTDDFMTVDASRYMAQKIPGAQFVEIAGPDHMPFAGSRSGEWIDVIEGFLTGHQTSDEKKQRALSILFTDLVGSTEHASRLGDRAWRDLKERHDILIRDQIERFEGRWVKSTGDGVLAAFDGPERAVRAAVAIRDMVGDLGLEIRAGLHTGSCELSGDDLVGLSVHIAARIANLAGRGELLVSDVVPKLTAGSSLIFSPRGTHTLRGVPGNWQLFAAAADEAVGEFPPAWASNDDPARNTMRPGDRMLVHAARVTPWLTRAGARLAIRYKPLRTNRRAGAVMKSG